MQTTLSSLFITKEFIIIAHDDGVGKWGCEQTESREKFSPLSYRAGHDLYPSKMSFTLYFIVCIMRAPY